MERIETISNVVLTQIQVAELLEVTVRSVSRNKDIPRDADGKYYLAEIVRWTRGASEDNETDELIKQERYRKLKRENDLAEGHLIDAPTQSEVMAEITDALRDFGEKMARKGKMTGTQVHAMFNQLLSKLKAKFDSLAGEDQRD